MNPFDFSRRWISFFGDFEKHRLEEIGLRVKADLQKDDKAVADGLFEAFGMLSARLAFRSDAEQEEVLEAFEKALGITLDDAIEDLLEAMLFSGDYARGVELCQRFIDERLSDVSHMLEHRSEFLVRLGRSEEAEASLISQLGAEDADSWLYVSLGDVFYTYQPVEGLRDLDAADSWYYRGFDRGFAQETDEAGRTLLKRLGQVCIDRLQRRACGRLSNALAQFGMGPNSYTQFVTGVRKDGASSAIASHLRAVAEADENGRGAELLQAIDDAVRFLPQDALDGMSPFEEEIYLAPGKNEQRIAAEMRQALGESTTPKEAAAFLDGKDVEGGRKRRTVIANEREKARKLYKDGKLIWKGFLRYREAVNLEQMFATAGARGGRGTQKDASGNGRGDTSGRRNGRAKRLLHVELSGFFVFMRIIVGSSNPVKVGAVSGTLAEYAAYAQADIDGVEVSSGVSAQPKTIEETVAGALNRARAAFVMGADLGFGIENGLMRVPGSKSGFMDSCVCAIYDGAEHHLGISSAFECPREVTDLMIKGGMDMTQAMNAAGYTDDPNIGAHEGVISVLTKGRVSRKDCAQQAVRMAMIHLDRAHPLSAE